MNELFLALVLSSSAVDGDTIRIQARVWPNILVEEHVRLLGIDTPEMKAAAPCERVMAQKAKDATTAILTAGKHITVSSNSRDSFGRILGDVRVDGISISDTLLARGVARKFGVKVAWC
jgi:endonuclease YncB( thermonuclease family)